MHKHASLALCWAFVCLFSSTFAAQKPPSAQVQMLRTAAAVALPPAPVGRPASAAAATALALAVQAAPRDVASFRYAPPRPIPDRYIVTFAKTVADPQAEADSLVRARGGRVHQHFKAGLRGFSATIPASELARLRKQPQVLAIEQDQVLQLNQATTVEPQATWGLDRIDQVDRPLDSQYTYKKTGAGVTAFIVDTGIRADHTEFAGRVLPGYSLVTDGNGTTDCNGHGTHVAAIVGGRTWGVAKDVKLVPVRVMDCAGAGTVSGVIAALDWAAASNLRPAVLNLSLGGGTSVALNAAVAAAVAKGLVVVVAAGNNSTDACTASPASEPSAITVGATTDIDTRAGYSNYGPCVDLFAPGSSITSAWHTSTTASNTISGTSMASPAVAGVAALALQANPTATPAAVAKFLVDKASSNKINGAGEGSPNKLVFSLASGAPGVLPVQNIAISKLDYSIDGSSLRSGMWLVTTKVAVRNVGNGAPVAGAQVTFDQSPGGPASCTTPASGWCTVSTLLSSAATIVVRDLSGSDMVYDAAQNLAVELRIPQPPLDKPKQLLPLPWPSKG